MHSFASSKALTQTPKTILPLSGQGGRWGGGSAPEPAAPEPKGAPRPFNQKRFEWFQAVIEKKKKKEQLKKQRDEKKKKDKK